MRSGSGWRFLLLFPLLLALSGCAETEAPKLVFTGRNVEPELFEMDGKGAEAVEYRAYLSGLLYDYRETFGEEIFSSDPLLKDSLSEEALLRLSKVKALCLFAEQEDIALSQEEERVAEEAGKAYRNGLSKEDSKALDLSEKSAETLLLEYALAEKVYRTQTAAVDPEVSDEEARVAEGEYLLFADLETAERARETILSGPSSFQGSAEGALSGGTYEKAKNETPEEEQVVFSLSEGEVSEVVKTADGFMLYKCDTNFQREKTDRNKERIVEARRNAVFEERFNTFAKSLEVRTNESALKAAKAEELPYAGPSLYTVFEEYFSG